MRIKVEVYESRAHVNPSPTFQPVRGRYGCIAVYVMNHDNALERQVLGMQCRYAFEANQCVVTSRVG